MERRRFLALGGAGMALVAGCPDPRETPPPTDTPTPSPSPQDRATSIFVATDGDDSNSGSEDAPVRTIQEGIDRAQPGQTIEVSAGTYRQNLRTVRGGTRDAPITITGPSDAVVRGRDGGRQLHVRHDHVHVVGLTFDGLQNPDEPDRAESYAAQNIFVEPEIVDGERPSYLRGIRITPHAVGNTQGACTNVNLSEDVEVGGFEVIGPAGLRYLRGEGNGSFGEIVYLGTFLGSLDRYDGIELDRTNDVHVHHIDNSEGHPHSNLVDAKAGTRDVTIEYCTDAGGAGTVSDGEAAAIAVKGRDSVVRWNSLSDGQASGIRVGSWPVAEPDDSDTEVPESAQEEGRSNSIYRNSIRGFADSSIEFEIEADRQELVCGNDYDDDIDSDADTPCREAVPAGDGIGHTGGDTPWE